MMSTKTVYRVAVIGGDGIGPEVLREGQKALAAVAQKDGRFSFEFTEFPWGNLRALSCAPARIKSWPAKLPVWKFRRTMSPKNVLSMLCSTKLRVYCR